MFLQRDGFQNGFYSGLARTELLRPLPTRPTQLEPATNSNPHLIKGMLLGTYPLLALLSNVFMVYWCGL
jgi:hypothetical protein